MDQRRLAEKAEIAKDINDLEKKVFTISTVLFFVGINVYCCSHQLNHQLAGGYRHDSKSFVQIDMSDFDFDG